MIRLLILLTAFITVTACTYDGRVAPVAPPPIVVEDQCFPNGPRLDCEPNVNIDIYPVGPNGYGVKSTIARIAGDSAYIFRMGE